ncbi:MAG: hypothetical protein QXD96_08145 [Pyrobaculum sp.]
MRGISGVVIAVLLTVIGIAAVLAFWTIFYPLIQPHPKIVIESATLTKIGDRYDLTIRVKEVGGASTTIKRITLEGPGITERECSTGQDLSLSAGQSKTIVAQCRNVQLEPGVTYHIYVYYRSGGGDEISGPHAVTPR